MAENSILWTTSGTGDGSSGGYSMAQLITWMQTLFTRDNTTEGVAHGYLNALAVTNPSGRDLAINTGAAMVYGFPYWNTASVTKTLTHPTTGTTGWRLVLRASWAAQTVRITLLQSADGTAAIPAVTQVATTTWDISLATGTITTGDVIVVTDARTYIHSTTEVSTAMIADDAVDDTKVGNRVPQFYRRQGGSATDWDTYGTTDYTPTTVRMQAGVVHAKLSSGNSLGDSMTVTFPVAFSQKPLVYLSFTDQPIIICSGAAELVNAYVNTVSAADCTIRLQISADSTAPSDQYKDINWLAIGPQ